MVGGVIHCFVWCGFSENVRHVTLRWPYIGGSKYGDGSLCPYLKISIRISRSIIQGEIYRIIILPVVLYGCET